MIDAFHFGKLQGWTAGRPEASTEFHKPQGTRAHKQSPGLFTKPVAAVGRKRIKALLQRNMLGRDSRQQLNLERKSTRIIRDTEGSSAGRLVSSERGTKWNKTTTVPNNYTVLVSAGMELFSSRSLV